MGELQSLSLFVGTGRCNAHCRHCAGVPLRRYAPAEDGIVDEDLIARTARQCYALGARSLSLSSSGEPTLSPLSVTKTLDLLCSLAEEGVVYSPINLYSNGIRIGEDRKFSDEYLPLWQSKGLTRVYITVHDVDEEKNARVYGVRSYPPLQEIVSRVHGAGLQMRANFVLSRRAIWTAEGFASAASYLLGLGVDYISAWPVRTLDDRVDEQLAPPDSGLDLMEEWIRSEQGLEGRIRLLREESKAEYASGRKLTLFPDGTLSSTWCNRQ